MKELRWTFLAVLAVALFLSFIRERGTVGISQQWTNGAYRFAGGTDPVALAFALIIAVLYLLLMFAPPPSLGAPFPGVFRRFVTFWLDFILAMMATAPVVGILPTLIEWRHTGDFRWNFERTAQAQGDGWLSSAGLILGFAALVFYYAFPLRAADLHRVLALLATRLFLTTESL